MEGRESQMKDYKLSAEALVMIQGSSAGTQPKYYDNGYWYKTNNAGYEGLSEYLVSLLLSCSSIKEYVVYEECLVNGRKGCRSKSFLGKDESFISFQRLYDMYKGGNLTDQIMPINDTKARIEYVLDFVKYYTDLDCSDYLSATLSLDFIILNTDRHFHNLGIIVNGATGEYRTAPVFDNGCSLLSDYEKFPEDVSIDENIESAYGQPFSSNLWVQASAAGINLHVDYEKLFSLLKNEPDSRALQVLIKRVETYKSIIS